MNDILEYALRALKVLHGWSRHELTNHSECIVEVWLGNGQVYKAFNYLLEPFQVASLSGVGAKHISVQRSGDGFAFRHSELEEHTKHVMSLAYECAFEVANHLDPQDIMKVPQVLHVE